MSLIDSVIPYLKVTDSYESLEFETGVSYCQISFSYVNYPAVIFDAILICYEFSGEVDAFSLKSIGLSFSEKFGWFEYGAHYLKNNLSLFHRTLSFAEPISLKSIHFRLWGYKKNIYIKDILIKSNEIAKNRFLVHEKFVKDIGPNVYDLKINNQNNLALSYFASSYFVLNSLLSAKKMYADSACNKAITEKGFCFHFYDMPMTLVVPDDIDIYMKFIGDSSRNILRKSIKLNFSVRRINPLKHLNEIRSIRISKPERQGRPIPNSFYDSTEKMKVLNEDFECYHSSYGEQYFGVFSSDGVLVAYSSLVHSYEVATINNILGHADFLKFGVMNLLFYGMVDLLIKCKSDIKVITYLYSKKGDSNSPLNVFKRSVGFRELELRLITDSTYSTDEMKLKLYYEKYSINGVVKKNEKNVNTKKYRRPNVVVNIFKDVTEFYVYNSTTSIQVYGIKGYDNIEQVLNAINSYDENFFVEFINRCRRKEIDTDLYDNGYVYSPILKSVLTNDSLIAMFRSNFIDKTTITNPFKGGLLNTVEINSFVNNDIQYFQMLLYLENSSNRN
jgi:hypothetical protein